MPVRLAVMSDLHLEIDRKHGLASGVGMPSHPRWGPDLRQLRGVADVCVLAGDIDRGMAAFEYADAVANFLKVPVVFVAGNHEFYHHQRSALLQAYRNAAAASGGRVHFLEDAEFTLVIDGRPVRFLGSTLWTDLQLYGAALAKDVVRSGELLEVYDYRRIYREDGALIGVHDPVSWHHASRNWLEAALADSRHTTVVGTHFAVSPRSIGPQFEGSRLNVIFASDLERLLHYSSAKLWIHGHTHHSVDYRLGRTRVVSAQRGYPQERDGEFRPMIVEVA